MKARCQFRALDTFTAAGDPSVLIGLEVEWALETIK
jgi:hypothetical protein